MCHCYILFNVLPHPATCRAADAEDLLAPNVDGMQIGLTKSEYDTSSDRRINPMSFVLFGFLSLKPGCGIFSSTPMFSTGSAQSFLIQSVVVVRSYSPNRTLTLQFENYY